MYVIVFVYVIISHDSKEDDFLIFFNIVDEDFLAKNELNII